MFFGNITLLIFLAFLRVDKLAGKIETSVALIEGFRIVIVAITSGLGIVLFAAFVRWRSGGIEPGLKPTVLTVLLLSSWLYADYFYGITYNLVNYNRRTEIAQKVTETENGYIKGHNGSHLSRAEYLEIQKMSGFPGMRERATDISYEYSWCDDFGGDNHLSISYNLPVSMKVQTFSFWIPGYNDGSRKVVKKGNLQRVTFTRGLN